MVLIHNKVVWCFSRILSVIDIPELSSSSILYSNGIQKQKYTVLTINKYKTKSERNPLEQETFTGWKVILDEFRLLDNFQPGIFLWEPDSLT